MNYYVFVYGTLLKGERNHHLLENASFVSDGYITNFFMFNLGTYPGIQKSNKDCKVIGEVYLVDKETLNLLDELEEEGYMYKKVMASVYCNNIIIDAYVYEYILEKYNDVLNVEEYDWEKIK